MKYEHKYSYPCSLNILPSDWALLRMCDLQGVHKKDLFSEHPAVLFIDFRSLLKNTRMNCD